MIHTVWNSRVFATLAVGSCLPELGGVGLPERSLVNRSVLAMAMAAGLACAIVDPLDAEIRKTIAASDLLMGKDEYAMWVLARSRRVGDCGDGRRHGIDRAMLMGFCR